MNDCYCADCPGGWAKEDPVDGTRFIRVCGCPCHEEHEDEDGAAEWQDTHDDTCDCDSCCGDDVEYEDDEPKPMRSTSADESPSAVGDLTAGGP